MNEPIQKYRSLIREMFLYGIFGLASASVDTLSFLSLSHTELPVLMANFISVNIGIASSFFLNTFINFRKSTGLGRRALKFYSVGYIGLALSTAIMFLGVDVMRRDRMCVKVISVLVAAAVQYLLNKLITYRN